MWSIDQCKEWVDRLGVPGLRKVLHPSHTLEIHFLSKEGNYLQCLQVLGEAGTEQWWQDQSAGWQPLESDDTLRPIQDRAGSQTSGQGSWYRVIRREEANRGGNAVLLQLTDFGCWSHCTIWVNSFVCLFLQNLCKVNTSAIPTLEKKNLKNGDTYWCPMTHTLNCKFRAWA